MEREQKKNFEWLIQFANLDLPNLGAGDKAKLLVESEDYLFPYKEMRAVPFAPGRGIVTFTPGNVDQLVESYANEMAWAFKAPPSRDSEEYWNTIVDLQGVVKNVLHELGLIEPGQAISWAEKVLVKMKWGEKKFSLSYIPVTGSHREYIRLKIYGLVNDLPRWIVSKCPGCNKYFFNGTLRKKDFCSPRCMWRVLAQQRRHEMKERAPEKYDAYLEKQKKIMRKKRKTQTTVKGQRKEK